MSRWLHGGRVGIVLVVVAVVFAACGGGSTESSTRPDVSTTVPAASSTTTVPPTSTTSAPPPSSTTSSAPPPVEDPVPEGPTREDIHDAIAAAEIDVCEFDGWLPLNEVFDGSAAEFTQVEPGLSVGSSCVWSDPLDGSWDWATFTIIMFDPSTGAVLQTQYENYEIEHWNSRSAHEADGCLVPEESVLGSVSPDSLPTYPDIIVEPRCAEGFVYGWSDGGGLRVRSGIEVGDAFIVGAHANYTVNIWDHWFLFQAGGLAATNGSLATGEVGPIGLDVFHTRSRTLAEVMFAVLKLVAEAQMESTGSS